MSHRTAVFIRMYRDSSDEYVDRARRFAGSLNGDNIKADVITLGENGTVFDGFVDRDEVYRNDVWLTDEELKNASNEQGYVSAVIFDDVQDVLVRSEVATEPTVINGLDEFEKFINDLVYGQAIPLPPVPATVP